ncbi:gamma-glutamyltransferase [Candidatus Palauibacter sp.]|uniref:gamma-glutamyltransferase n=1 Tax=Candidatus Palauibacter sp. TaxID=3101350 RepID=UPI003B01EE2B
MRRRDFLATSAAAAAGSSLIGCRPPETASATATAGGQWGPAGDSNVPGLLGPAHRAVWGARGVTAAADYYASLAGTTIMMQGGNAVDAIVAAAAMLNVSEPYMSGIGGFGGFMLIYLAEENRVVGLDALGRSPAASSPDTMTLDDFEMGYKAPIVPGAFKGWAAVLERHGTMSLGDVFEPAIQLAEDGFVVSRFDEIHTNGAAAEKLGRFPSTTRVFFPNGRPPRMGEIIKQPDLAASMRRLAREGADDFYKGELGDRVVSFLQENGGHMTKADLESFDVTWKEPITTTFQGHDLYAMPPGSCGMSMFQALNIMDGFDLPNMDLYGSEFAHLWLEAYRLALIDDDRYNTGKEDADIPVDMIISKEYADEQRATIDPARIASFAGAPLPFFGTTSLSSADRWGNAVAFTQSLVSGYGSGVIAGDTGIFLNNGHTFGFVLEEGHVNHLEGGQKAKGVMTPCVVMKDGNLVAAVGAAGGYTIPQTVGQVITKLTTGGMDIQLAIASPRMCLNRGGGRTPIPEDSVTYLEAGFPPEVYGELADRGHNLAEPGNPGGVQGVYRDAETGALAGGSDPRRDGHAIAW